MSYRQRVSQYELSDDPVACDKRQSSVYRVFRFHRAHQDASWNDLVTSTFHHRAAHPQRLHLPIMPKDCAHTVRTRAMIIPVNPPTSTESLSVLGRRVHVHRRMCLPARPRGGECVGCGSELGLTVGVAVAGVVLRVDQAALIAEVAAVDGRARIGHLAHLNVGRLHRRRESGHQRW